MKDTALWIGIVLAMSASSAFAQASVADGIYLDSVSIVKRAACSFRTLIRYQKPRFSSLSHMVTLIPIP